MLTLSIEKRDNIGKASKRREEGNIPAVFYGPKESSTPISLSMKDFLHIWKEAGESSVITLTGVGEDKETLIYDVDLDPVTERVRHVDFYVIEKGKKVQVAVPLEFIGEAPAVKELGGTLVKVMHELQIEVMPKDLPHEISVDVSGIIDFETQLHVSDIAVPSSVTVLSDLEEVVALVSETKEEEESTDSPDLESIEVEQKGKTETDSEEDSKSGDSA